MALSGIIMWMWMNCLCFWGVLLFQDQVSGSSSSSLQSSPSAESCDAYFLVTVPAVLQAGTKTQFCAVLQEPGEFVIMSVHLKSENGSQRLLKKGTSHSFIKCFSFHVPLVEKCEIQLFEVIVEGQMIYSKEVKKVLIKTVTPKTFIQTDTAIYNPGQTVRFRAVTLDRELKPVDVQFDFVLIKDPHGAIIGQWVNQTPRKSILELSFQLSSGASEGYYRIVVKTGKQRFYQSFKVQKFSLPKFDITVTIPKEISVGQKHFEVEVCAKSKCGKPVSGNAMITVCRPVKNRVYCSSAPTYEDYEHLHRTSLCTTKTKQLCRSGCATLKFEVSSFTGIDPEAFLDVLDVSATVRDKFTSIAHTKWERINITYVIGRLSFLEIPKTYTQGHPLNGKVQAVNYDGSPAAHLKLYLFNAESLFPDKVDILETDQNGVAPFSLDTNRFSGNVPLKVSAIKPGEHEKHKTPFFTSASITVSESGPEPTTGGFLRVQTVEKPLSCGKKEEITIQYSLKSEYSPVLEVIYLVLSRGEIVFQGIHQIADTDEVLQGAFSFPLKVTPDMAPFIQVVAYVVLSCEKILAHSAEFPTEECFRNEVTINYNPSFAVPGEKVRLSLKADPDSLCGVRAIDFRTIVKEWGTLLDAHQIFDILPIQKPDSIPHELSDFSNCLHVRPKRSISRFTNQEGEYAFTVFEQQGMLILSNLDVQNPNCLKLKGKKYFRDLDILMKFDSKSPEVPAIPEPGSIPYTCPYVEPLEPVHTLVSEPWIFDLYNVGSYGKRSVHLTVPDVVTSWDTDAFCLNSHGFGLAQRKTLFVSPPFVLHLAMPDSAFLGESFVLKATVTNNLQCCMKIKLTPTHSSDVSMTQLSSDLCTYCLCGGESKSLRWTVAPTALGTASVIITATAVGAGTFCEDHPVVVPEKGHTSVKTRSIDVKTAGAEIRQIESWLLCSKGPVVSEIMDVEMPEDVVPGSLQIKVAAMGDILGRLVHNLGRPLDFPYENGDWNIASMAINIYVLNYLKETHQLEQSMKEEEAVNFLTKAYQNQLSFKDKSGAFGVFRTGPRSSWLTALVMVTLYQAQSYIFIDDKVIDETRKWLECQQRENGCFKVWGKHSTKRKRGCVVDEVAYNAFILAAFLEMGVSPDDPVVKKGLCCLKESIEDPQNPFAAAISAWVFTLAGDMEHRSQLLDYLDKIAIKERDVIYWSHTETETSVYSSLLISSYVLLAKLTVTGSPGDLRSASLIFKWLVEQQNYCSTFSSTQDTMMAVKAIALYSKCMFTPVWSSTVSVWSPSDQMVFQLTSHNKLHYQEMVLQDTKGKYSVKMEGMACALVQLSFRYNTMKSDADSPLSVDVQLQLHPSRSKRLKFTMKMTSLYYGHQLCTNMVVLEIQLPSGFCPLPQSLRSLRSGVGVEHVDYKDNRVFVYVRKLHKNIPIIHKLHLMQEYFVFNSKPVTVLIYDYNNPAISGVTQYCVSSLTKDKYLPYHHHKDEH